MEGAVAGGTIRLDVAKLADLKTRAKSKIHSIAGRNWHIEAKLTVDPYSWPPGRRDLEVFVQCSSERKDWSYEADINYTLLAKRSGEHAMFPTGEGRVRSHLWLDILNPVNAPVFGEDCGVVIEATVTVKNAVGAKDVSTAPRMPPLCDLSIPQKDITDVALIIGEKRLYVSKQLLAVHSPVFRTMFFSEFDEKNKKEIQDLEDLDFDEFLEFLHVVYPSRKPVTAATVEFLLRLGDRFNVECVIRECEQFLTGPNSDQIPLEKRLLWADRFRCPSLQFACLDSLKTVGEVKALTGTIEYGQLSDKAKVAVLEKLIVLG